MKRFLLFSYEQYYPYGGWGDFRGSFETLEDADAGPKVGDYWHIVDLETLTIVKTGKVRENTQASV